MAKLILPSRFSSQPQYRTAIDAGNPLTRGIVEAWHGAAGLVGVNGRALIPQNSPSIVATQPGLAFKNTGARDSGQGYLLPNGIQAFIDATKQATALFVMTGSSTNEQGGPIHTSSSASADLYPWSAGVIYQTAFSTSQWVSAATPPVDITKPHIIAFQFKNGTQRCTQNGLVLATNTLAADPLYFDGQAVILSGANSTYGYQGGFPLVVIWNRYLSDAEVTALSQTLSAPWQIFKAPTPHFLADYSAPAGGSVFNIMSGRGGGAAQPLRWAA